MTPRKSLTTTALTCAVLAGSGLLAGCQNGSDAKSPSAASASASAQPHGYVEGAEEASEQQSRLVLADAGTGAVEVLDLITEDTTSLSRNDGVRSLRTDGRFAYLSSDGGTRVVDTGAWTVDHGDHVHYYRAAIRDVGAVAGAVSLVSTVIRPSPRSPPRRVAPSCSTARSWRTAPSPVVPS